MTTLGFESLTDDVKQRVRSIVASRSIDGTLRFALLDTNGDELISATATNTHSWDECKDLIGPLLNRHGLGYKTWRSVPRQVDTWHADVRPLMPEFGGEPAVRTD